MICKNVMIELKVSFEFRRRSGRVDECCILHNEVHVGKSILQSFTNRDNPCDKKAVQSRKSANTVKNRGFHVRERTLLFRAFPPLIAE